MFDDAVVYTCAPLVLFSEVPGCQVYVVAPVALNAVDAPEQMPILFEDTFITGNAFTETTIVFIEEQPLVLPVTV